MAILENLPGIEVVVCVDGEAMTEFVDGEAELRSTTMSSYIQSETGVEFSVKLIVKDPFDLSYPTLGFQIFVDGVKVREPLLRQAIYKRGACFWESMWGGIKLATGNEEQDCIEHPFKFSKINTSADDKDLDTLRLDAPIMQKVGEIVVKLHRRYKSHLVGPKLQQHVSLNEARSTVHERALKGEAKSHGIVLGEARASTFSQRFEADFMDGEDSPIAEFRFKYRAREALQSLLVIPRSPEPEEAPATRTATPEPSQQSSALDIGNLIPRARRQVQNLFQMLQSGGGSGGQVVKPGMQADKAIVKRVREDEAQNEPLRSRKTRKHAAPAFIDLTLD